MRYILCLFLLIQLLFSNNEFSNEEKSVFGTNEEKVEQVQNKEILTLEQPSLEPVSPTSSDTQAFPIEPVKEKEENKTQNIEEDSSSVSLESANNEVLNTEQTEENKTHDEKAPEQTETSEDDETASQSNFSAVQQMHQQLLSGEEESVFAPTNNDEESTYEEIEEEYEEPIDYFTKVEFENGNRAKSLYLSYPYFPKKIYKNQRFEIVVKALVTTDDFYTVETRFIDSLNMTVLNPQSVWTLKDNNTFENKYYFKAFDEKFIMPTLQVLLYKDNQVVEVEYIKPEEMSFSEIAKDDEKFSSIIAKNLTVNAYKSKQYNNNELIMILDVEAYESNLEDFNLRFIEEQGFSKITDNYPEQQMLYYLVMPIHKKKVEFNYYNTELKKFKKISIPVVLDNELVSTQTDLNPNTSNLLFYKKVALSCLSLLFLILFIWKRKYIYLIFLLVAVIVLIIYVMPNKQAFIKSDTTIYILPTNNSTIFYKTQKVNLVQVAMKKEHFVKIIMNVDNKKIIGWIKEDKLVEN